MKKFTAILCLISALTFFAALPQTLFAAEDDVDLSKYSKLSDAEYQAAYKSEPASGRVINIGYDGGLCQAAIPIAQNKGFFTAEGLETKLTRSESARDAIAGGKIDTSAGMIAAWLKPITNGVDIVFTVGLHTGCASAIVLSDSGIESFDDVKGGTIAINGGIGGVYHNIAFRFVAHDGFKAADFKWKDFPADQSLLVLQRGEAKIAVLSDQLAEKWVQEGQVRRIRSLTFDKDFVNESCCVMGISGKFLNENPVTSEKITRAIYKASLWLNESEANRREAAAILLDGGHISGTPEYALDLLNMYRFGLDNATTEKSLYDSVDEYKALGVLDEKVNPDELKTRIWKPLDLDRVIEKK
ncbi:MAG: ABC transporter substrate-binding protein [Synergistaceae bacterium]|jgi:NitT/TauT family transport system substrate-binding protein|nr:ABC transporter substrate-binding protein [Synergistaceae bacterium]